MCRSIHVDFNIETRAEHITGSVFPEGRNSKSGSSKKNYELHFNQVSKQFIWKFFMYFFKVKIIIGKLIYQFKF